MIGEKIHIGIDISGSMDNTENVHDPPLPNTEEETCMYSMSIPNTGARENLRGSQEVDASFKDSLDTYDQNKWFFPSESSTSPTLFLEDYANASSYNCVAQQRQGEAGKDADIFSASKECYIYPGIFDREETSISVDSKPIIPNDKLLELSVEDCNDGTARSTTPRVVETATFLDNMRQQSESRIKILEDVPTVSPLDGKSKLQHLKPELEMIEKLDMKLQELEDMDSSANSSRSSTLSGSKGIPPVIHLLRDERKRLKRQAILKRIMEKLDPTPNQNSKHILRNVRLGPRARYFSLTEEEEALVEDILLRPDFFEEEIESSGNSVSSSVSTAFDFEGEAALRMAQIDERLEQFIEIHSACGTPSLTSVSLSMPKLYSTSSQTSNRIMKTPSIGSGETVQIEEQNAKSVSSSVEDYLLERKESREHQAKIESIDRRLRELMMTESPVKLTKEELDTLVSQCMMERNLEETMRPFLCIKT